MLPPQIFDTFLVIKVWGVEASAIGLPAIIALCLILVAIAFLRTRRR
jgi:hypothetical protein